MPTSEAKILMACGGGIRAKQAPFNRAVPLGAVRTLRATCSEMSTFLIGHESTALHGFAQAQTLAVILPGIRIAQ